MSEPPKKPSFKKSFSVPKLKTDNCETKKQDEESNNEKISEKVQKDVKENKSAEEKENVVPNIKKRAAKKSLFQAPVTGESVSTTQQASEESAKIKKPKKKKNPENETKDKEIPECKSDARKKGNYGFMKDVRFFPYPTKVKNARLRSKWLQFIRRPVDYNPTRHHRVCSRHFVDACPTDEHPFPTLFQWNNFGKPDEKRDTSSIRKRESLSRDTETYMENPENETDQSSKPKKQKSKKVSEPKAPKDPKDSKTEMSGKNEKVCDSLVSETGEGGNTCEDNQVLSENLGVNEKGDICTEIEKLESVDESRKGEEEQETIPDTTDEPKLVIDEEIADLDEDTQTQTDSVLKEKHEDKTPPRSLSDAEYEEIFQAVLERCESTTLEEMYESLKKPEKEMKKPKIVKEETQKSSKKPKGTKSEKSLIPKETKKPKEKKAKKKTADEKEIKECREETQVVPIGKPQLEDETLSDDKGEDKDDQEENAKNQDREEKDEEVNDEEGDEEMDEGEEREVDDEEIEQVQAISEIIPDEVVPDLQGLSNINEPNFQDVNEVTPEGSEIDYEIPVQRTPPAKKTKKLENNSSLKKHKLAPKQLIFPKGEVPELKKVKSAVEKGSSKKQLKMDDTLHSGEAMPNEKEKSKKTKQLEKKVTCRQPNKTEKKVKHKEISPEKDSKPIVKEKSRRKELQERLDKKENLGTWVQCSSKTCSKWRFLPDCEDPSTLPEVWTCNMNNDERYNSCTKAEQNYNEDEHIFTVFSEGSVVWAKMTGFPWWPAMVDIDPDTESYFLLATELSMYPSHYHVVFFDDKVSRAWVNCTSIRKFTGGPADDEFNPKSTKSGKGFASFSKDISRAKDNALLAFDMSVQDRLKNFSFVKRYKGVYGRPVSDSPEACKSKPKKKKVNRKRKISKLDNDMIESALEESMEGNEDAVLKGFEEVLDAMDEETSDVEDEDEDYEVPDEESESISKPKSASNRVKRSSRQSVDAEKPVKIKKPKMFIVEEEEEEMVVPTLLANKPLKFDADIFTMDMGDDSHEEEDLNVDLQNDVKTDVNKKSKGGKSKGGKTTKSFTVTLNNKNKENCSTDEIHPLKNENPINEKDSKDVCLNAESDNDKTKNNKGNASSWNTSSSQNSDKIKPIQHSNKVNSSQNSDSDAQSTESDSPQTCTVDSQGDNNALEIEADGRQDETRSLEQDEQLVPGDDDSQDEEMNLEFSLPMEDKHPHQIVNHVVAPVTVELAYDSDPFDMEE